MESETVQEFTSICHYIQCDYWKQI